MLCPGRGWMHRPPGSAASAAAHTTPAAARRCRRTSRAAPALLRSCRLSAALVAGRRPRQVQRAERCMRGPRRTELAGGPGLPDGCPTRGRRGGQQGRRPTRALQAGLGAAHAPLPLLCHVVCTALLEATLTNLRTKLTEVEGDKCAAARALPLCCGLATGLPSCAPALPPFSSCAPLLHAASAAGCLKRHGTATTEVWYRAPHSLQAALHSWPPAAAPLSNSSSSHHGSRRQ